MAMRIQAMATSGRERARRSPRVMAASAMVVLALVAGGCGPAGPPDIETARAGLPDEYRIVYEGEDGKTVLALLREHAEPVVTEQQGDDHLVTAINGIEHGVGGRYWIYYVNGQAGQVAASRLTTVDGDEVEWLFVR